jgi:hypothetical protein
MPTNLLEVLTRMEGCVPSVRAELSSMPHSKHSLLQAVSSQAGFESLSKATRSAFSGSLGKILEDNRFFVTHDQVNGYSISFRHPAATHISADRSLTVGHYSLKDREGGERFYLFPGELTVLEQGMRRRLESIELPD